MTNEQSLSIALSGVNHTITMPNIIHHMIEDGELERFMELSTPTSISIGVSCLSYAVGSLRDLWPILSKQKQILTYGDMLFVILFALSIVIGVTAISYGLTRKRKANKLLEKIRSRPAVTNYLH